MPSFRPYTTRCITLRGRHLHLYAWGAEQPDPAATLFCLHGWGDLGASFQFVVDALPQDWCILAPVWRGFGRSAHNDGPYWFPDYLADLDALLEALSPNRPATLVGHSLGGIVASLYAGIRPERVAHLALLEGLVLWSEAPERAPERCAGWLDAVRGAQVAAANCSSGGARQFSLPAGAVSARIILRTRGAGVALLRALRFTRPEPVASG